MSQKPFSGGAPRLASKNVQNETATGAGRQSKSPTPKRSNDASRSLNERPKSATRPGNMQQDTSPNSSKHFMSHSRLGSPRERNVTANNAGQQSKSPLPQRGNVASNSSPQRPKSTARSAHTKQDIFPPASPRSASPRQGSVLRPVSPTTKAKALGGSGSSSLTFEKDHDRLSAKNNDVTESLQQRAAQSSKEAATERVEALEEEKRLRVQVEAKEKILVHASRRAAALEEENENLRVEVHDARRSLQEAMQRIQVLEDDRDVWKRKWDQNHDKLEQAWRDYDELQQRWEEAEEHLRSEKWNRHRDRERLQMVETLLKELSHTKPSTEMGETTEQEKAIPETSTGGVAVANEAASDPGTVAEAATQRAAPSDSNHACQRGSLPSTSMVQPIPRATVQRSARSSSSYAVQRGSLPSTSMAQPVPRAPWDSLAVQRGSLPSVSVVQPVPRTIARRSAPLESSRAAQRGSLPNTSVVQSPGQQYLKCSDVENALLSQHEICGDLSIQDLVSDVMILSNARPDSASIQGLIKEYIELELLRPKLSSSIYDQPAT